MARSSGSGAKRRDRGRANRGARSLRARLRTAKGRKTASARWLERQLNDPYVHAARRAGYRSRAAFKLIEIDDRYGVLARGARVVDLGAAPGGWSQVASERVGAAEGMGQVVAVDVQDLEPLPGVIGLMLDFMDREAPGRIGALLKGGRADVVLSDMAAPATGHKHTDHLRVVALCEAAFDFAETVLAPGGVLLAKVLQGGTEHQLLQQMKRQFETVRHVKPKASRSESAELYVLARGYRGAPGHEQGTRTGD